MTSSKFITALLSLWLVSGCQSTGSNPPTAHPLQSANHYISQQRLQLHVERERAAKLPVLYSDAATSYANIDDFVTLRQSPYQGLLDYDQDGQCDDYDPNTLQITANGKPLVTFRSTTAAAHDIYGLLSLTLRLQKNQGARCHVQYPASSKRFLITHNPGWFTNKQQTNYNTEVLDLLRTINRQLFDRQPFDPQPAQACSQTVQNERIHHYFLQNYLWRDLVPEFVDYTAFDNSETLVKHLINRNDQWSYSQRRAPTKSSTTKQPALPYIGISTQFKGKQPVIQFVHDRSPAQQAGLRRGDIIVSSEIAQQGNAVELTIQRAGRQQRFVVNVIQQQPPTIPVVRVFKNQRQTVGYMLVTAFTQQSMQEIDQQLATLKKHKVQQLIIDLRYNPGGLVDAANYLGSAIAPQLYGKAFAYSRLAGARHIVAKRFRKTKVSLPIKDVVFLTSKQTISASEQLILALQPYIEVKVVGTPTYGKSVWLEETQICDTQLLAANAIVYNAKGDSIAVTGIAPTCLAKDELSHALTSKNSRMLAHSMALLQNGRCDTRY